MVMWYLVIATCVVRSCDSHVVSSHCYLCCIMIKFAVMCSGIEKRGGSERWCPKVSSYTSDVITNLFFYGNSGTVTSWCCIGI